MNVAVSSDVLQNVLSYLRVGQIALLSSVSISFNLVCKRELLWKCKVMKDYNLDYKFEDSWRKEAKILYLDSEKFWSGLKESISRDDMSDDDLGIIFVRAVREKEEFYVAELIFKLLYANSVHYVKTLRDGTNFYKMFSRIIGNIFDIDQQRPSYVLSNPPDCTSRWKLSEVLKIPSVRKILKECKLSLRWILDLNEIKEIKLCPNMDMTPQEIKHEWIRLNLPLYSSTTFLARLYNRYRDQFMNDTTVDQKNIVLRLNLWK